MFGFFKKPTKDKFAALILQRIKAAGGPTDYDYDRENFSLKRGTSRLYLGNTYDSYCLADAAHRETILANLVSSIGRHEHDDELTLDDVRSHLVTVVRERVLFSFSSLHWQLEGLENKHPAVQHEPVSAWFARALVIDAPGSMSLVNTDQIERWHHTSDEIYALGLENLRQSTEPRFVEEQGVFRGLWNDDYDSSRILLPGLFDDLPLRGEPVVAIPNRLTLLVTGSEDPAGLRRLLARAEEIVQTQARRQNPAPLLVRDGVVTDFNVGPSSPVFHDVQRARRFAALLYYQEQQQTLEKLYEKQGKDLFIARYNLSQHDDGRYASHAGWTKGARTLLPVTDELMLMDLDRPEGERLVARVDGQQALAMLGDLMLDTKMFPPRYYVSTFPSEEHLRQLR